MTTTSASITHKAPVMFCAPGNPQDPKTSFGGYGDSIDSIVPWPGGSQITVATMPNDAVPNWVLDIIKSVVNEWIKGMEEALTVQWLSAGSAAQIRISFRTDVPNWSCVGARARLYDQSKPTINFNFGGWKDSKAVYSHAYIKRLAAHLFGHALGLPHAQAKQTLSYNKPELEKFYGAYYADMIQSAKGCPQLQDNYSIMHHDVLSALSSSGVDVLQGGRAVDNEARALLQSLYPTWPKFYFVRCRAQNRSGFKAGVNASGYEWFQTTKTSNIVTGLCRLDMGTNGNFRLQSSITSIVPKQQWRWDVGTWSDTNLFDASYSVLSFQEEDQRVQTGHAEWRYLNSGMSRWAPRSFSRPFKKTPKVVTFITGFDTVKGYNIRIEVSASNITKEGFTINMNTWGDSAIHNVTASWIAHEPDDWTIRSGILNHAISPGNRIREERLTRSYSSPFPRRPSEMFLAFSHLDVPTDRTIRLNLDADWNEKEITGIFSTWEEESKFYSCLGCYVALY